MRNLRTLVILFPVLALPLLGLLLIVREYQREPTPIAKHDRSPLVVVCVFDHLRPDYAERWLNYCGSEGFRSFREYGLCFEAAEFSHGLSHSSPGYATIATGVSPAVHGIVADQWYSAVEKKLVRSIQNSNTESIGPGQYRCTTIGDELIEEKRGRVFSFALDAEPAVLLGGQLAQNVFWYHRDHGAFRTSPHYRKDLPEWVTNFNRGPTRERWLGEPWTYLKPNALYQALVGANTRAGMGELLGRTFPHTLPGVAQRQEYYQYLAQTPFGDELLWEFAKAGIAAEAMGQSDASKVDLLYLGFTSNRDIGRTFGPHSQELLDSYFRTDELLSNMIQSLDTMVGPGRYTLVVTASHGLADLPETVLPNEEPAKETQELRFEPLKEYGGLEAVLAAKFGNTPGRSWIEHIEFPWVYLNHESIQESGIPARVIEEAAVQWCTNHPDRAFAAYSRSQLQQTSAHQKSDPLLQAIRLSFVSGRSGDIFLVPIPKALPLGEASVGTTSGSPYCYDRTVPLLFFGGETPRAEVILSATPLEVIGPILRTMLGLDAKDQPTSVPLPEAWAKSPTTDPTNP